MPDSSRRPLFILASGLLAAVPVTFGIIRAVGTGDDFRYLWLAGAAIAGSMAAISVGRGASGASRVSLLRASGAVAAGAMCAAATALLLGATAGPGVAIVAMGFGLCTGASAVFAGLAWQSRTL